MVNQKLVSQSLLLIPAFVITVIVVSTAAAGAANNNEHHHVVKRDACFTCLNILNASVRNVSDGLGKMWDHIDGQCGQMDENVQDGCYHAWRKSRYEVFIAFDNGFEPVTICERACNNRKHRDIISASITEEHMQISTGEQQKIAAEKLPVDVCKTCKLQIHGGQRYVLGKFHVFSNRLNEGCSQVDSMIQSTCFSASTATIDSMTVGFEREFEPQTICQPVCDSEP